MTRAFSRAALIAAFACISYPASGEAACSKVEGVTEVRFRILSPLVADQIGPSVDVAIDVNGCVTARYPAIDRRHGTHRFQMAEPEFVLLKREIAAARLDRIDAPLLKKQLAQSLKKSEPDTEYITTDADIIQIDLGGDVAGGNRTPPFSIQWVALEQDLLNHPESAELQALAAVKARLNELSTDKRLQAEVQP